MRAVVLDWMNEVCSTYKMQRVTYYMALNYLDRYLASNVHTDKSSIQLIGVTCLLIAAKLEEVNPPLLSDLALLTDNGFSEKDIQLQEVILLVTLDWEMRTLTIIDWLDVFMPMHGNSSAMIIPPSGSGSLHPAHLEARPQLSVYSEDDDDDVDRGKVGLPQSTAKYIQAAQLIDLCALDIELTNYSYPVIAAAIISHIISR